MRLRRPHPPLPLLALALATTLFPSAMAFSCALTASNIPYDLTPLSGLRESTKETPTPPTVNRARVLMSLCGDGIGEDGGAEEDQCPSDSYVCLKLLNIKESASDPERITAVIPFWSTSTSDEDIHATPLGKNGQDGLRFLIDGPDYAEMKQQLNLTLLCAQSASDPEPTFVGYAKGVLSLEWATPDACPRDPSDPVAGDGGSGGGGSGFWGFIKFVFWLCIIGLILYFVVGIFYNHQQYSAKGWDLVPHRDFWRELPALLGDLFSHVFAGLRGGGSRGGYSSLG